MWLSQYNFLCLLNLPEQVDQLDPVQNRWEGGIRGEKFLRQVKPVVTSVSRKNWAKNLLLNLLRQRELLVLRKQTEEERLETESKEHEYKADTMGFTSYTTIQQANEEMSEGKPISCIIVDNAATVNIFVSFKTGRTKNLPRSM
jgi:hypothetical protein